MLFEFLRNYFFTDRSQQKISQSISFSALRRPVVFTPSPLKPRQQPWKKLLRLETRSSRKRAAEADESLLISRQDKQQKKMITTFLRGLSFGLSSSRVFATRQNNVLPLARPVLAARQRREFSASDENEKKLSPAIALIFDTETSDRVDFKLPAQDPRQPNLVQLGMMLVDTSDWKCLMKVALLIDDVPSITPGAQNVHGISVQDCQKYGVSRNIAMELFVNACLNADILVAHNLAFDRTIMETALYRNGCGGQHIDCMSHLQHICTMHSSTEILKLPGKYGKKSKWPSLQESYSHFTVDNGKSSIIEGSHDALVDTEACLTVFRGLVEGGNVKLEDCKPKPIGMPTVDSGSPALPPSSLPGKPNVDPGTPLLPPSSPPPKATNNPSISLPPSDTAPNNLKVANPGELRVETFSGGFWVKGNTYKYKDSIKSLGGKWDPACKAWSFTSAAMPEVRRLVGLPDDSTGGPSRFGDLFEEIVD
jgi:DNA polymerase-3 subunit epsilon